MWLIDKHKLVHNADIFIYFYFTNNNLKAMTCIFIKLPLLWYPLINFSATSCRSFNITLFNQCIIQNLMEEKTNVHMHLKKEAAKSLIIPADVHSSGKTTCQRENYGISCPLWLLWKCEKGKAFCYVVNTTNISKKEPVRGHQSWTFTQ